MKCQDTLFIPKRLSRHGGWFGYAYALCIVYMMMGVGCDEVGGATGGDLSTGGLSDTAISNDLLTGGGADASVDLGSPTDVGGQIQDIIKDLGGKDDTGDEQFDAEQDWATTPDGQDVASKEDLSTSEDIVADVADVLMTEDIMDLDVSAQPDIGTPNEDTTSSEDVGLPPDEDVSQEVDIVEPPVEEPTYTTGIGPFTVGKFEETTKCVVVRLKNPGSAYVKRISQTLAPGSHHLVVYRSTETQEIPEPFNCTPFLGVLSGTVPIFISQIGDEELKYPDGVALKFEADQMIRIEAHYLNTTGQPIQAKSEIHFETVDAKKVIHEAGFLFYGSGDISIPPFSEFVSKPVFKAPPKGSKVFGLTSHQHHYGTFLKLKKPRRPPDPER